MNPQIWIPLAVGTVTTGLGSLFQLWLYRRLRSERGHLDEIAHLQKDLVHVRERIRYIEGRMNGKMWLRD